MGCASKEKIEISYKCRYNEDVLQMPRQKKQLELRVRVSEVEMLHLKEEAERRGMTISELVRYATRLLREAPKVSNNE